MEKVNVRVIGKPYRRNAPGDVIQISRQDAKLLTALGRVEAADAPDQSEPAATTPAKPKSAPRKRKTK